MKNNGKKELAIDFLYLDLNTCERCKATDETLKEALAKLDDVFKSLDYDVKVNTVNITSPELAKKYEFLSSPTIRVNGVDICSEFAESSCTDCSNISGTSTDCRVFVYEGEKYEMPPVAMIMDGILKVIYGGQTVREKSEAKYEMPDNIERFFSGKDKDSGCGCDGGCGDSCDSKSNNSKEKSSMKSLYLYEPAMCCPTGLCGVNVDPDILRIAAVFDGLKKNGVTAARFNSNSAPQEFVKNAEINQLVNQGGVEALPATVVNGKIVKFGKYPSNEEIAKWLDIPVSDLGEKTTEKPAEKKSACGCSCKGGC